jgi:hypothetical protein
MGEIVRNVESAARLLSKVYVEEGYYGPIDRLGTAKSRESVLVALYEALRGIPGEYRETDEYRSLENVVKVIIHDLEVDDCFERAVRLANMLGVKTLALARRGG